MGQLAHPAPGGVDHEAAGDFPGLPGAGVAHAYARDLSVGAVDGSDFRIGAEARAMPDGVLDVLPDEAEAVHGGVGYAVHGHDITCEVGFERPGFLHGDGGGFDPAFVAGRDPRSLKLGPVFGRADEEAFGFLDAVLADAPEDAVFLDTFPPASASFIRVARAAVEQAVEAGELVPWTRSRCSSSSALTPRMARSRKVPAPVAPPPMTTTSQCRLVYSESSCMDVPVLSGFVPGSPRECVAPENSLFDIRLQ